MNPYPSGQGDNICNIWQKGLHLLLRYRMDLTGIVVLITVSWPGNRLVRQAWGDYGKLWEDVTKQGELILENGLTSWPSMIVCSGGTVSDSLNSFRVFPMNLWCWFVFPTISSFWVDAKEGNAEIVWQERWFPYIHIHIYIYMHNLSTFVEHR